MSKSIVNQVSAEAGDVLEDVVHSLKKMAKHLKTDAADALSNSAASLVDSAIELAEEAKAQSKAAVRKVGEEVREHPATTAAIAAAAVALIGIIVAYRRSSRAE